MQACRLVTIDSKASPFFIQRNLIYKPSQRAFSSGSEIKEFEEQVKVALSLIQDEQGKSLLESGLLHSVQVVKAKERSELLNVIVKLNLTKEFRRVKGLITENLTKALPWANKINVSIAPQ